MVSEYIQAKGYSFKYQRISHQLSLRDLAQQLGVSHTLIANLEKGIMQPTDDLIAKYHAFFKLPIENDETFYGHIYDCLIKTFDAILFHDFQELEVKKETLVLMKEQAYQKGLKFHWDLCFFIIHSHHYLEVLNLDPKLAEHLAKMGEDLNPFLRFLLDVTLALYDRYHFRLTASKKRLERLASGYLNPHHKALVKDRLSDLYYHTFDRSKAIKYGAEAIQTYQVFHNTNRAILTEIKISLYGKRQHTFEKDLPYQHLIDQANVYKLYEVIHDISYVWALRVFRFQRFQEAKNILRTLDLSHPQFYHYYVIVLFGSNDIETLKDFLKNQPLKAPHIEVFKPSIEYIKAYLNKKEDDVLERYLIQYLKATIKEELYGESRWAENLLNDFYIERRRYKEATHLKESLIELILT